MTKGKASTKGTSGPPAGVPSKFKFQIGGFDGGYRTVRYDGDELLFDATGMDMEIEPADRVRPDPEAWQRFARSCDRVDVWGWRKSYSDPMICDGTQWELKLCWDGRSVSSSGSNAYPGGSDEFGSDDYSPKFKAFLRALSRLTGGHKF